jgi:hypothetical protein
VRSRQPAGASSSSARSHEKTSATPDTAPTDRESHLELTSLDPADLTLRAVALLADADQLVFAPGIPDAIRRYARRDATVVESHAASTGAGHTVHVRLAATSSPTTSFPVQEPTHE